MLLVAALTRKANGHLAAIASCKVHDLDKTLVDRFFPPVQLSYRQLIEIFICIGISRTICIKLVTWLSYQFYTHVSYKLQLRGLEHGHHCE